MTRAGITDPTALVAMLEADLEAARDQANRQADRANAAEAQLQHAILDLEACEARADEAEAKVAAGIDVCDQAERERLRGHVWLPSQWQASLRVALR